MIVPGSTAWKQDADRRHAQPPVAAALTAGEFAVHRDAGDVDSVAECRGWLDAAGWTFESHLPLAGPRSLVTAVRA